MSTPEQTKPHIDHQSTNPSQAGTIRDYLDPNSDTYGNKVRSYLAHHPAARGNYESAASSATRLFRIAKEKGQIEQILDEIGQGEEVRLRRIANAAAGTLTETSETVTERDGKRVVTRTTTGVPHTAQVQYHKMLMQLTGATDRARALGKAQGDELIRAQRSIMRRIKAARAGEATDAEIVSESDEEARHATSQAADIESLAEAGGNAHKPDTGLCYYCGDALPPKRHRLTRYCSRECRDAADRERKQARVRVIQSLSMSEKGDGPEPGVAGGQGEVPTIPSPPRTAHEKNLRGLLLDLLQGAGEEERRALREAVLEATADIDASGDA